jgi:two-component system phosphate regulon sensor histidine kinase PhoR
MNIARFRLLVFFMSLSLVGIILVQLYWVNSSLKTSDDQFRYHIQRILGKVSSKIQEQETRSYYDMYKTYKDSTGREPFHTEMLEYYKKKLNSNEYLASDAGADENSFFDSLRSGTDTAANNGNGSQAYEIYQFEKYLNEYRKLKTLEQRITKERLRKMLATELRQNDVTTPFEFAVYSTNGHATPIRSENFKWDPSVSSEINFLTDNEGISKYRLLISFPEKQGYLFSSILGITSLSLIFTLIIIIAYLTALSQLIKQKQISEIKTDFINNMTHEFKTPIATINLALDAIKNPKIFEDKEKMQRYLQMIRDENKRMHAQVENVLQISRLDKKELEITKEPADIHNIIEDAIEHVHLIIEARHGTLTRHFNASRTTALLNDVHFTNVLVNILDNAIKYSPDEPVIDIYTENVKDFILIKIQDRGLGMSKTTQKRIFEKFYREHTGDIHNVKGHGLGLAYVKRIIDDHNCHIYVESEKGKGSTFIIKMPLIN